jgi:hypothetical protein
MFAVMFRRRLDTKAYRSFVDTVKVGDDRSRDLSLPLDNGILRHVGPLHSDALGERGPPFQLFASRRACSSDSGHLKNIGAKGIGHGAGGWPHAGQQTAARRRGRCQARREESKDDDDAPLPAAPRAIGRRRSRSSPTKPAGYSGGRRGAGAIQGPMATLIAQCGFQ